MCTCDHRKINMSLSLSPLDTMWLVQALTHQEDCNWSVLPEPAGTHSITKTNSKILTWQGWTVGKYALQRWCRMFLEPLGTWVSEGDTLGCIICKIWTCDWWVWGQSRPTCLGQANHVLWPGAVIYVCWIDMHQPVSKCFKVTTSSLLARLMKLRWQALPIRYVFSLAPLWPLLMWWCSKGWECRSMHLQLASHSPWQPQKYVLKIWWN